MSKAKSKNTTKPSGAKPSVVASVPDAEVIRACINYAIHSAASMAACAADPDGNSKNAMPLSTVHWNKAECALIDATAQAHTLRGIRAKARLLTHIQEDEGGLATLTGCEVQFARSVGRDVEALLSKWDDLTPSGPTDRPTALAPPSLDMPKKAVRS